MAAYNTILTALFAVLALWSIILAGTATRSAVRLFDVPGRFASSNIKTMRNGAALLAFDAFVTFFLALALAALLATGRAALPPLVLLAVLAVLWVLWLAGAAAFSNGFDALSFGDCSTGDCNTIKATVAFAWLGWITLSALLGLAIFFVVKPPQDHDGHTSNASPSFSLAALRKNKNKNTATTATDVEKQPQPHTAAGAPYGAMPAAATDGAASGAAPNATAGYTGQAPDQQAFAGAYGSPSAAQQQQQPASGGAAPYDAAQAYAQQEPYSNAAPQQPTAMPQPQAPAGWSVAPLGSAPQNGAAPTAEIVAGPPRQE